VSEQARNALLRRVDWRFLVQSTDEPRITAHAGDMAQSLALVSADGEPDLAALVDPSARELADAAAVLPPGGTLYAEWYRLRSRRRLTRELERAGVTDVRWYWPWPRPSKGPAFWLPLDAPDALAFFLEQRRRSAPLRRRVPTAIWPLVRRVGLLVPLCAVARKPGGAPDAVDDVLRRHADGGRISWILLAGGRRTINKVVGLPVVHPAKRPEVVVKFARSAVEDDALRREHDVLQAVEAARPEQPGVPKALFLERRAGRLALGETALEGEPLIWQLNRSTLDRFCGLVTDWLVGLVDTGRTHEGDWRRRLVGEPFERFARDYASVVGTDELDQARAAFASLPELPVACEERDCAPWNVLLAGDAVSLADWESAEPSGLPGLDLVYFLANAALVVDGVLDRGPVVPVYLESRRTLASHERRYCDRTGLDEALLPVLRLLCWTIHARSEAIRFEQDAAGAPSQDTLAGGVFLALWRAELGCR
jgi:Phosphotransferase enzyme family